jgi:hypothetical protein
MVRVVTPASRAASSGINIRTRAPHVSHQAVTATLRPETRSTRFVSTVISILLFRVAHRLSCELKRTEPASLPRQSVCPARAD